MDEKRNPIPHISAEQIKEQLGIDIIYSAPEAGNVRLVNLGKLLLPAHSPLAIAFMTAEVKHFSPDISDKHALIPLDTQYGRVYLRKVIIHNRCDDCGTNRCENYMLTDDVWLRIVPENRGILCFICLEKRLGRAIEKTDFQVNAPCNARYITKNLEEKSDEK